ncbi:MAG: DUF362 domain-containing protein [Candidatus Brocadiia bacterium]
MKSKILFKPVQSGEDTAAICDKVAQLFQAVTLKKYIRKDDLVALKIHMGEGRKKTFVSPDFIRPIIDQVKECGGKPFVTDTNTLYTGRRSNAVDHLMMAHENGFSVENLGCPVIIGDGMIGESQVSVMGPEGKWAHICGLARRADVIIGIAHCTGHLLSGYGGALKNIGMGLAGRGGKLDQHSGVLPDIAISECVGCGICVVHCPARAISLKDKKAYADRKKCYGCGECYAVCPNGAVKVEKWHAASDMVQAKMARYCSAILKDRKALFINFAINVTKNCDCIGEPEKPIANDTGILAGTDPVALDVASIKAIIKTAGADVFKQAWPDVDYNIQFREAEKLGVGSTEYEVVND